MIKFKGVLSESSSEGLSNQEGCEALEAILAYPQAQILVSKRLLSRDESTIFAKEEDKNEATSGMSQELPLEEKVKLLWLDVLGVKDISDDSDFFDLGGDSLASIQLSYKLKVNLGIDIPPDVLLTHSRLKDFLKQIKSQAV